MRIVGLVVFVLLFSATLFAAEKPESPYNEAKKLIDAGEYAKAEEQLTKLISANPKNAKYYQLMGDLQNKQGRSEEALKNYEKAKGLHGENPELLKGIATSQKRLRNFHDAEKSYNRAIELAPKDEEAKDDLNNLKLKRGLQLKAFFGGWEPDYTRLAFEGALFYGGFDRFDLNAGYSYADQTYYTRHKVFANGITTIIRLLILSLTLRIRTTTILLIRLCRNRILTPIHTILFLLLSLRSRTVYKVLERNVCMNTSGRIFL